MRRNFSERFHQNGRWLNSISLANRRKGVSLALETVVVLVLAVLVLTVLLFFFQSQYYPAQTKIEDLNKQRELCGQYVNNDPKCEGKGTTISSELTSVCNRLGYEGCKTNNIACVQKCCALFCTGTANTCKGRCIQTSANIKDCPGETAEGTCPSGQICCK